MNLMQIKPCKQSNYVSVEQWRMTVENLMQIKPHKFHWGVHVMRLKVHGFIIEPFAPGD